MFKHTEAVGTWGDMALPASSSLSSSAARKPKGKRGRPGSAARSYDAWDAALDRGRVKKVKTKRDPAAS